MEDIKHIFNPDDIYIGRKEIYSGIFEYSLPWGYEFWSCGSNYGNRIYAGAITDNYYTVKKRNDGGYKQTDSNNQEV